MGLGGWGGTTLYHLLTCGGAGVSIDSVPSGGSDAFLFTTAGVKLCQPCLPPPNLASGK